MMASTLVFAFMVGSAPKADVEKALASLQAKTAKGLPAPDEVDRVKALFDEMFDVDQGARKTDPIDADLVGRVDAHNRDVLKQYLSRMDWFRISVWGESMDNRAWLIAQHADRDVEFQKDVLRRLEKLVALKETSGSSFAYLFDRVATNTGKKQRYGTQGRCVGPGNWQPGELEDPARVDELRRESGIADRMGTLAQYQATMNAHCK